LGEYRARVQNGIEIFYMVSIFQNGTIGLFITALPGCCPIRPELLGENPISSKILPVFFGSLPFCDPPKVPNMVPCQPALLSFFSQHHSLTLIPSASKDAFNDHPDDVHLAHHNPLGRGEDAVVNALYRVKEKINDTVDSQLGLCESLV
jgi:hypothetical protein